MLKSIEITIILFCLFISTQLKAQHFNDYKYIDSLTFNLYLQKDWKNLSKISRNAFKNDIDYYYLRMRAGIAFFERGNYIQAEKHFKKAITLNNIDYDPKEYLCYSYLFSGKKDDAKRFYNKSEPKDETLKIPALNLKPLSEIIFNSAYFLNLNSSPENELNFEEISTSDGYQIITKSFLYNSLLIKHDISPSLYLSQAFTGIIKNQYYINSYLGSIYETLNTQSYQFQYYLSAKIIPVNNFSILSSMHYVRYQNPDFYVFDKYYGTRYIIQGIGKNYLAGDISVFKSYRFIKTGLGLTLANLNDAEQFQKNFTLVYFPLGNLNLYLTSVLNHVKEIKSNTPVDINTLFRQTLGFKVFNKLWMETTVFFGTIKNVTLNEGYIIHNNNESINDRIDVTLILPLNKVTFNIFLSYNSCSSYFIPTDGVNFDTINMNFTGLLSLISIKWNL